MDLELHKTRYEIVKHFAGEIIKIYRGNDLRKCLIVECCKGKLLALLVLLASEEFFLDIINSTLAQIQGIRESNKQEYELAEFGAEAVFGAAFFVAFDLKKFVKGLVEPTIDAVLSAIPDREYFYERQVNAFFDDLYDNMRKLKIFYSNYKTPFDD